MEKYIEVVNPVDAIQVNLTNISEIMTFVPQRTGARINLTMNDGKLHLSFITKDGYSLHAFENDWVIVNELSKIIIENNNDFNRRYIKVEKE